MEVPQYGAVAQPCPKSPRGGDGKGGRGRELVPPYDFFTTPLFVEVGLYEVALRLFSARGRFDHDSRGLNASRDQVGCE